MSLNKLFLVIMSILLTTSIFAETKMTKSEMIKDAEALRNRPSKLDAQPEEIKEFPADEKAFTIPTSQGDAKVFLITSKKNKGEKLPLVINMHGGGFVLARGSRDFLFCAKLVNALPVVVLDVDYVLAPENPFPAGVIQSYEVVQWAFENAEKLGIDPTRIAVAGQSAGANVAIGTINMAIDKGTNVPKLLLSAYAPTDLNTDPMDKEYPEGTRPGTAERAKKYNAFYVAPEETKNYLVSPIFTPYENLVKFPTSLFITAAIDELNKESEVFSTNLVKAGVEVTAKRFLKSPHGFTINRMGEYKESIDLIVRFLKDSL